MDADLHVVGVRVLAGVRQRLGDDEIGGRLDRRARPLGELDRDVHVERGPRDECLDRWIEAAVGEDRRVDPAGEVPKLLEGLARARPRFGEEHAGAFGVGGELLLGHPDAHAECDETGLRAVVQVALDAPELRLLHVDRAGARGLELLDPVASHVFPAAEHDRRVDARGDTEPQQHPGRPEVPTLGEQPLGDEVQPDRCEDPELDRQRATPTCLPLDLGSFEHEHHPGGNAEHQGQRKDRLRRPEVAVGVVSAQTTLNSRPRPPTTTARITSARLRRASRLPFSRP